MFLASGAGTVSPIIYITLVQTHSPPEARGRVMAFLLLGVVGPEPLSLAIGGRPGAAAGGRAIFLVSGIVTALAGIVALSNREFREAT